MHSMDAAWLRTTQPFSWSELLIQQPSCCFTSAWLNSYESNSSAAWTVTCWCASQKKNSPGQCSSPQQPSSRLRVAMACAPRSLRLPARRASLHTASMVRSYITPGWHTRTAALPGASWRAPVFAILWRRLALRAALASTWQHRSVALLVERHEWERSMA